MRRCSNTSLARSMGYMSSPSQEETQHNTSVIQMPMIGAIRSYHNGGLSNRELFMRAKAHRECVNREFRL